MNQSYLVNGNLMGGSGTYNYKLNADGSIGVDYFFDGKPVSNTEFQAFTGADIAAIEQAPYAQETPAPAQEDTSSGSSSAATGPTEEQVAAYNAQIEANYQMAVAKAERDKATQIQKYQDSLADLTRQEGTLGTQKDEGMQGNSSYFSQISPDAFQSQIVNYNNKVQGAYQEGMNTVGRNKQRVNEAVNTYQADVADYLTGLSNQKQMDLGNYGSAGNYQAYAGTPAQPYVESNYVQPQYAGANTAGGLTTSQMPVKGVTDTTWDWLRKQA